MDQKRGKQSICFENPPYIISRASIAGIKEGQGPLGKRIDVISNDDMFGMKSWEEAESEMQRQTVEPGSGEIQMQQRGYTLYLCR